MRNLRIILCDQLNREISSLRECNKIQDRILMCETSEELLHVKHHKKKIVFLLSSMRHFANELLADGYNLTYTKLEDPNNTGSLSDEVAKILNEIDEIIITHPSEYRVLQSVKSWHKKFHIPVKILEDNRFLCLIDEFKKWSLGRKVLRMEHFYREMRIKHNILIENKKPVGGKWNYDNENRKTLKNYITSSTSTLHQGENQHYNIFNATANHALQHTDQNKKMVVIPLPYMSEPDHITNEVTELVREKFRDHFGELENFHFAVTRSQAIEALRQFIRERLPKFGDYQDTMLEGEPWIYHSHLSMYINCGLLSPLECIKFAEQSYYQKNAPINAVEGFIRQILGWREYIRGIYWLKMPEYTEENFLEGKRNLPNLYWDAQTNMNCLKQCLLETKKNAYTHHIQRLMILGNFALLTEVEPKQINEWFLVVYADAYEWVELPNVSGMSLFADGGYLASKPYAASGNYINKMSNYCKNCIYNVNEKVTENACPFNYLYWNFLAKKRNKLKPNPRMSILYKTYDTMSESVKTSISQNSENFFKKLDQNRVV